MDSLFCGKATAVATVPRTVAKSRLSNPQKSKKTSFRLSFGWQQTQFSIRVALGCKVALKCNPKSICNRPTNWNLSTSYVADLLSSEYHKYTEYTNITIKPNIKIRFSLITNIDKSVFINPWKTLQAKTHCVLL